MLVFGDTEDPVEAVEKGRTQSPLPSGQEEATDQLSTAHYCSKLMCCIVGLQGAYLTWGVLQVGRCGAWLLLVSCLYVFLEISCYGTVVQPRAEAYVCIPRKCQRNHNGGREGG